MNDFIHHTSDMKYETSNGTWYGKSHIYHDHPKTNYHTHDETCVRNHVPRYGHMPEIFFGKHSMNCESYS